MLSRGRKILNLALEKASDQASTIISSHNEEKLCEPVDIEIDVTADHVLPTNEVGLIEIVYFDANGEEISREKCEPEPLEVETTESATTFTNDNAAAELVTVNTNDDNEDHNIEPPRRRSKRQNVNSCNWHAKRQRLNREQGLEYEGRKKINDKILYDEAKMPRTLKPRCKCTDEKVLLKCSSFNEDERLIIFNTFWKKTWEEKKIFVQLLTDSTVVKRPRGRTNEDKSRRKQTFTYFLKKGGERIRVCKTFFTNTLNIGEWTVSSCVFFTY